MSNSISRNSRFVLIGFASLIAGAIGGLFTTAVAQTAAPAEENSYIAVVKGADVYVRCGAAESYYPFAKVNDGDLVKVTGDKYDWARVMTTGPVFESSFGFVKTTKGDATRFRLSTDGKSGVTLGKTDIIAPNLDAKCNPKDSWKSIVRLEADQTLNVIETTELEKETIYRVELPAAAQGWINKAYLERATDEQASQWKDMMTHKSAPSSPKAAKTSRGSTSDENSAVAKVDSSKSQNSSHSSTKTPDTSTQKPSSDADTATSDGTDQPKPEPGTPAANETPAPKPQEKKLPTLDDLEAAYKLLQKEPIETAEVMPLRELYLDLAERSVADKRIIRRASGRADQLQIWADLQKKRQELDAVRTRSKMSASETEAVQKALEQSAEYTAVGRIAASTIYDGQRLPKLLRVQDASTGRTIAYLQPDEQYELVNLVGNLVGIVGEKTYDETLRLNVIAPHRIDLLSPEERQAAAKTEQ